MQIALKDKIAVVTGGSRGIGRAISMTLLPPGQRLSSIISGMLLLLKKRSLRSSPPMALQSACRRM